MNSLIPWNRFSPSNIRSRTETVCHEMQKVTFERCLTIPFLICLFATNANADVISIRGGTLTMNFDANALASTAFDTGTYNPANGPYMVLGRHYTASEVANRRVTSGTNRNGDIPQIRNLVNIGTVQTPNWTADYRQFSTQPGYAPPNTIGLQYSIYDTAPSVAGLPLRFPQSSNFQIDLNGNVATAIGQIGIGGADSFHFGNTDFFAINGGGINNTPTNINLGDYSVYFDASRLTATTSGWVFSNHLGVSSGSFAFDTFNTSITVTPNSFTLTGDLLVGSDLTDFSGLTTGARVGTFSLNGITAVPEPSSIALLSIVGVGAVFLQKRRSKMKNSGNGAL